MTLYLSLSGVSSYLQLPTMTIKKIVIDGYFPTQTGDLKMLLDSRDGQNLGYVYARSDGSITSAGGDYTVTNYARNVRRVVEFNAVNNIDGNGNFTDNTTIFANKTFGDNFVGLIYDVKCYNALGVLVAHYDMNTGTTQDQTGNGNHATFSGGTWLDDTKTYYLQMDGINDYLQTPSLTFTECIMEFSATPGVWRTYFDANAGVTSSNFTRDDTGKDLWGVGISAIYKDGVLQTSGTNGFVNATKATFRIVLPSAGTDNVNIFANQLGTGTTTVQGKLYNVKFYNGASLVAHIDLTKGHLIDLSGNGKTPTLTGGGTWVEDVVSGGSIIDAGTLTFSGDTTITVNGNTILNGISSLSAEGSLTLDGSLLLDGISVLSANTTFDVDSSLILNGDSTFSAISSLESDGSVIYNGVVSLSADTSLDAIVNLIVNGISSLSADGTLTVDAITFDPSKQIITKIQLNGLRELIVNSEGQRELTYQVTTTRNLITKLEGES